MFPHSFLYYEQEFEVDWDKEHGCFSMKVNGEYFSELPFLDESHGKSD